MHSISDVFDSIRELVRVRLDSLSCRVTACYIAPGVLKHAGISKRPSRMEVEGTYINSHVGVTRILQP